MSYSTHPALLLVVFLLLSGAVFAQEKPVEQTTDPALVAAALEKARAEGSPYRLEVDCTDENGLRNLGVFESGVAIWDDRAQLTLSPEIRDALLEILLRHDFASLEPLYGGKRKPGKAAEAEPAPGAALRVRCRVEVVVGGLRKSSAQDSYGEQSAELSALATALLDRVEPLAEKAAITVPDLGAGLAKLADGSLAPEALELRFVELPARRGEKGRGMILHVEGGMTAVRSYEPGREVGEAVSEPISGEALASLVAALREARYTALPVNLWSAEHLELEVRVLDQRKAVVARPFGRLTAESLGEIQKRFDALVEALREFRSKAMKSGAADGLSDRDPSGAGAKPAARR